MKGLRNAIEKKKTKLIRSAHKNGVYENFGQKEVMQLSEKYIDLSDYSEDMNKNRMMINAFNDWCSEYSPY